MGSTRPRRKGGKRSAGTANGSFRRWASRARTAYRLFASAAPPNQALHLIGAATLISRGILILQAAPAGELSFSLNCGGDIDRPRRRRFVIENSSEQR
jgi:hypothetical protein